MPTYQYRCTSCDDELEVVQKFTDPALSECPACTGALRKVYNAVGVVFKGSGFYRTDSRTAPSESKSEGAGAESKTDAKSGDGKTGGKDSSSSAEKSGVRSGAEPGGKSGSAGSTAKVPAGSSSSSTGG